MLGHAQFLRDTPFEIARDVYAGADLTLAPDGSHGDAIACTAAAHFADDFALFHHSNRGDVTVTAHADTPGVWMSVPVAQDRGGLILRPTRSRLAVPGRHDPMRMRGGEARLGLSVAEPHLEAFSRRVLDRRYRDASHMASHIDMAHPSHRAAGRLVIDMTLDGTADPMRLGDARAVAQYLEPIMLLMLTHFGEEDVPPLGPHPRDVKRTIDYIEAHLAQPVTLGDLVRVANVPLRTLSAHFKQFTGTSPMAYLAARRLDQAHDLITMGGATSVTEAAFAAGITHLGRFSAQYRERFGEVPSETLQRTARARLIRARGVS